MPQATQAMLNQATPQATLRRTGIDVVGDASWGTHFCQFYSTKDDLADVLVPYFRAGLEADEFCMWVTSPPLGVRDAWSALAQAVPDLDRYRERGRIEIVSHADWYLLGGTFDQERVLEKWVTKLQDALARGCAGLRLSGNTFWLEKADWRSFAQYEAAVDRIIGGYRMLALCTYSLDRCGASEVADVIRNHQFALIKREGRWERIESADRQRMERRAAETLRRSEERVRLKLESVLSPQGDIGKLELSDIVDVDALRPLLGDLHEILRIPMAVIDLQGRVLVGVGWQDVCTKFHRVHPETCRHCIESDTQLTAGVPEGECRLYRCKNGLWDVATPLVVGGHRVGNLFMGQFFFDDEHPDRERFRAQAARYGFDEERYLATLDAVPRLTRDWVNRGMAFFLNLAAMLSKLSYGNVCLARAISEREALMTSLRQTKERLEEIDRRKDEFLGMLSHELRNPLAPIRNAVYVLDHVDPAGEQARRARGVIDRQSAQLTRLVDDLLDVTRIAHGKVELRRGRVDLAQLVRRAGEDHGGPMRERGLEFVVEVPDEPMWVDGDAVRLVQIVGNLLHNSAKFTSPGGRVTLALERIRGAAEIHVRDTGAGIEPELLAQLFEPFVQAERTLARTSGGLGLGLPLVKGFAEMHGGSVRAASAGPGQGAELVVRLPLAEEAAAPLRAGARPRGEGHSLRVLVVDDNRDGAETLAELVEMFGHAVEIADDGPAALATARARRPDVVLCDIGLPGMSGYDVARALRADPANAAVQLVAVSGYAQPGDLRRAAEAGFDRHVAKPLNPEEFERLLADGAREGAPHGARRRVP
jgi:signal transduction histidine kinase/CheY-like chemotaxis protein